MPARWDADARNIGVNRNLTEMADRLDSFEADINRLNAEVERLQQKVEKFEADLDSRSQPKQD